MKCMKWQGNLTLKSASQSRQWILRSQLNFRFETKTLRAKNKKSIAEYRSGPQKLERAGEKLSFKTKFVPIRLLVLKCELCQFSIFLACTKK